jgi:OmcA/MtrC family decaheme c-type cytochrome
LVDNGDGTYVYTFGKDITTVPGVPFVNTATHRLAIQISGTVSGGSLNDRAINIIQDFVPANLPAFTGTTPHDIVTAGACNTCHYKIGTTTPHGGRVDTKYCVVCHTYQRANGRSTSAPNASGVMTGSTYLVVGQVDVGSEPTSSAGGFAQGELVTLVHKLHNGEGHETHGAVQGLKLTGYNYGGVLFNEVHYPQDARNCAKCHAGPQADNWKNKPGRKACGCHDNTSFAATVPTGFVAHSGGAQADDSGCALCHPATGAGVGKSITDAHVPVISPDPADPRLGGTNTHTNGSYVAAAGAVPAGAHVITYLISSVTKTNNHPSITFKLQEDGVDMLFDAPTGTTSELKANYAGSPSVYFVWAEPQDGITAPSDFNKSASVYIKSAWNHALSGSTATMTGPDGSGFYTITRTGTTIPATAVMLTGGVGYTYGSGSPELVQTNLAAYPYNAGTGVGGLAVPPPNVWKVATGFTGRRVAVDTAKCNACHAALGVAPTFHNGQRNDAPTCSFCHNPGRTSSGWSANASTFVHAIHGSSKREVPFVWAAASETDNFSKVTYPNLLNNCLACHVAGYYDFSAAASSSAYPNRLFETVATGTMASTSTTSFAFSPYITVDLNYGPTGSTDNLVTSPTAGVCFACHDSSSARNHMTTNGAAVYEKRSVAIP